MKNTNATLNSKVAYLAFALSSKCVGMVVYSTFRLSEMNKMLAAEVVKIISFIHVRVSAVLKPTQNCINCESLSVYETNSILPFVGQTKYISSSYLILDIVCTLSTHIPTHAARIIDFFFYFGWIVYVSQNLIITHIFNPIYSAIFWKFCASFLFHAFQYCLSLLRIAKNLYQMKLSIMDGFGNNSG